MCAPEDYLRAHEQVFVFGCRQSAERRADLTKFVKHAHDARDAVRLPPLNVRHPIWRVHDHFKVTPTDDRAVGEEGLEHGMSWKLSLKARFVVPAPGIADPIAKYRTQSPHSKPDETGRPLLIRSIQPTEKLLRDLRARHRSAQTPAETRSELREGVLGLPPVPRHGRGVRDSSQVRPAVHGLGFRPGRDSFRPFPFLLITTPGSLGFARCPSRSGGHAPVGTSSRR